METITTTPTLPARPDRGHKGTFGRVLVIGGCAGSASDPGVRMIGAPALAALGATRAGCGLVRVMTPEPIVGEVLTLCPSATGVGLPVHSSGLIIAHEGAECFDRWATEADAIVLGCGLGRSAGVDALVVRAIGQEDVPVVLDADGLNALAEMVDFARDVRAPLVLTPHPGEFARLAGPLRIAGDATSDADRPRVAGELARKIGAVVMLKGARTAVSDGQRAWTCDVTEPCLATGGTGDVLAGVVGGLIAQARGGGPDLFNAARAGVEAHARAARAWREHHNASGGMTPADLLGHIPHAVEQLRDS